MADVDALKRQRATSKRKFTRKVKNLMDLLSADIIYTYWTMPRPTLNLFCRVGNIGRGRSPETNIFRRDKINSMLDKAESR